MKAERSHVPDNREDKVTTTIRFDAQLHEDLNDYVHDRGRKLPPRERPTKDSIVQDAVRALISGPMAPPPAAPDWLPEQEAAALKYIAYHMSLPLRDERRDAFVRHFVLEIIERMKTRPMPE